MTSRERSLPNGVAAEIRSSQRDRRDGPVVALEFAVHHVAAIGGEEELRQETGITRPVLDQRSKRPGGHVDTLENALPVMEDFVGQPVFAVSKEWLFMCRDQSRIALRSKQNQPEFQLVEPQMQDRVVKLARQTQHIGVRPLCL